MPLSFKNEEVLPVLTSHQLRSGFPHPVHPLIGTIVERVLFQNVILTLTHPEEETAFPFQVHGAPLYTYGSSSPVAYSGTSGATDSLPPESSLQLLV